MTAASAASHVEWHEATAYHGAREVQYKTNIAVPFQQRIETPDFNFRLSTHNEWCTFRSATSFLPPRGYSATTLTNHIPPGLSCLRSRGTGSPQTSQVVLGYPQLLPEDLRGVLPEYRRGIPSLSRMTISLRWVVGLKLVETSYTPSSAHRCTSLARIDIPCTFRYFGTTVFDLYYIVPVSRN